MLALQVLSGAGAEGRADDAADDQDHRQHQIDGLVGDRVRMVAAIIVKRIWNSEVR